MQTYCVHIYPRAYEYESIKAKTPKDAERKAVRAAAMDYEDIERLEVMRECECGTDNDPENKTCEECGKKL